MVEPERDVEQDFACRHAAWPASRSLNVKAHLFVARTPKPLLFGMFSDPATDIGSPVRPSCEAVDLVE